MKFLFLKIELIMLTLNMKKKNGIGVVSAYHIFFVIFTRYFLCSGKNKK